MPTFVLALIYALHLLATVVWLGGLVALALVGGAGPQSAELSDALSDRLRPLGNLSLAVLVVTGMIQMGGDPHYEGFLAINNPWSVSLLIKHLVVLAILAVAALMQFSVQPALARARLLEGRPAAAAEVQQAVTRQRRLNLINLLLGGAVLLLTAVLTAL